MLKKSILAALVATVLGLSLTACSSDCAPCTKAPVYKRPCSGNTTN